MPPSPPVRITRVKRKINLNCFWFPLKYIDVFVLPMNKRGRKGAPVRPRSVTVGGGTVLIHDPYDPLSVSEHARSV